MLGNRYNNDGIPHEKLNAVQLEMKKSVDNNVAQGIYTFESIPCPICETSDNFEKLSLKDMYGLYMPVVVCRTCGLLITNPRMTQESYNLYYNNEYLKLDRPNYERIRQDLETFFSTQRGRGEMIWKYLESHRLIQKKPEDIFVLEVGCSAGGILQYFKDRGCRIKGVDLGKELLDYGKKRGLDLALGTIFNMTFDRKPDIIIYSHVLEHILKPNEELAHLKKIAAHDALLYIALPGVKHLNQGKTLIDILRNAHVTHFSLRTLSNLLRKNGWKLVVGNEKIQSIFRTTEDWPGKEKVENDYNDVMRYLKRAERMRAVSYMYHKKIKIPLKMGLRKYLVMMGLLHA